VSEGNKALLALMGSALLFGCSARAGPSLMSGLLAKKPVCLAADWGADSPPTFFGSQAPDTLLLLAGRAGALSNKSGPESHLAVAITRQNRDKGWIWWIQQDTLWISSQSPTMDNVLVQAITPGDRTLATWRGTGMSAYQHGQVVLHRFECRETP
jgi:hypothetical protein